ncbi:DNA polymerase [Plantactinospora solaniradicis]|uniref:DNA-directed DNA polymerase n=1 Tax=Plantactinospora solaniradicis TaxID=1723736 RepID=A0ABW1K976_9ACTN
MDLGPPVHPGQVGTFSFASSLNAQYTVGREPAIRAAMFLAEHEPYLALDIETEGVDALAMRLKVVTVGSANHAVVLDPRDPAQADAVRRALEIARVLVVHNSPFDVPVLVRHGLMRLADVSKVKDTLVYCRLAEPDERTSKSLLAAGHRYLHTSKDDVLGSAFKALGLTKSAGFKTFDIDRPIYVQGAAFDVILTARLLPVVRAAAYDRLTKDHPFTSWGVSGADADELVEREQTINHIFVRRSAVGIRVDLEYLDGYRADVRAQQDADRALLEAEGVRPGHGGSLTGWLDQRGLLPENHPRTEKTGAPAATKDALARLEHPVAVAFVRLKQTEKIERDYLQKVVDLSDEHDRIHPTTTILGAATGRMSMSGPPLQQFSGPARGILLADRGDSLTSIDWSQIEPVVAANIARDQAVLTGYEDGSSDLYTTVAKAAGIVRKKAKVMLLAQMYGEGMTKLSQDLGINIKDAWELRDTVFRAMPRVGRLIKKLRDIGEQHRLVFTLSGRIVPVPSGQFGVAVHKAVNYFVQGGAYDVLADTLIRIDQAGLSDAVYLAMHDELVVSTAAAEDVRKIMESPPERLCRMSGRVPVLRTDRADLGDRWSEA